MARKNNAPVPPANERDLDATSGDGGAAADAPKAKRPRKSYPTLLMEELGTVHTGSAPTPPANEYEPDATSTLQTISGALRRVEGSPEFADGPAAIKWAAEAKLTGIFHPVIDKGAFMLETVQETKIVVKARTS